MDELEVFYEILDKLKDAVMITDGDLRGGGPYIVWVNNRFCEKTGYSKEEIIGKSPKILQSPTTSESVRRKIREAIHNGSAVSIEIENQTKTGELFWTELSIYPIANCKYFLGFNRFPSERQQEVVKILERGVSSLANNGSRVLFLQWLPDENWTITVASRNCRHLLGYLTDELEGDSFKNLLHPEDLEEILAEFLDFCQSRSGAWERQYRLLASDGYYENFFSVVLADWGQALLPIRLYGFLFENREGILSRTEMEREIARQLLLQKEISKICSDDEISNTARVDQIQNIVETNDWNVHYNDRLFILIDRIATIEAAQGIINNQMQNYLDHNQLKQKSLLDTFRTSVVVRSLFSWFSTKAALFGLAICIVVALDATANLFPQYSSILLWFRDQVHKFFTDSK
ncbi:MAG TPA: PAS domain-containing protein [Vampirovibrionales bacterium]